MTLLAALFISLNSRRVEWRLHLAGLVCRFGKPGLEPNALHSRAWRLLCCSVPSLGGGPGFECPCLSVLVWPQASVMSASKSCLCIRTCKVQAFFSNRALEGWVQELVLGAPLWWSEVLHLTDGT